MSRAPPMTAELPADETRDWLDRAFRVLGNRRRCFLYVYLYFYPDDEISIDQLTTQLVDWEQSLGATEVSHTEIAVALIHNHLPKLADAGVIDYDRETGQVHWRGNSIGLEGLISVVAQAQHAADQA